MSGRNSALASLTANYTDSEDEDHSPVPFTHTESSGRDESRSGTSHDDSGTMEDGVLSGHCRSVDTDSGEGNTRNTLVSYNFQPDLIDDHAIDDFPPIGLGRDFQPGDEAEEDEDIEMKDITENKSPRPKSPQTEALETVSSEDEMTTSSPKKTVKLPPEPTGKCSAKLQEKFTKMYEQKVKGQLNMNEVIQTKKMFRNPSIYEKLISHLDIDEFGTNYPENMFNPHEWKEGSFYDELAKVQKTEMDRREKERRDRTKVEFVSGTAKKTLNVPTAVAGSGSQSEGEKRKSKWDQRGVMPPLLMTVGPASHSAQPPVVNLPASIINSVNAAAAGKPKTVTISAFGSLPKRK